MFQEVLITLKPARKENKQNPNPKNFCNRCHKSLAVTHSLQVINNDKYCNVSNLHRRLSTIFLN